MSVTIRDIAKIAGVSHATVSRSLNDSDLVKPNTKEKIKEIADKLGFKLNANARSLITSRTNTISIVYLENTKEIASNTYYISLINEIQKVLEKHRIDVITSFSTNNITGESNIKRLINSKKIDGIIIVNPNLCDKEYKIIEFNKEFLLF